MMLRFWGTIVFVLLLACRQNQSTSPNSFVGIGMTLERQFLSSAFLLNNLNIRDTTNVILLNPHDCLNCYLGIKKCLVEEQLKSDKGYSSLLVILPETRSVERKKLFESVLELDESRMIVLESNKMMSAFLNDAGLNVLESSVKLIYLKSGSYKLIQNRSMHTNM